MDDEQKRLLDAPLKKGNVSSRSQSGTTLSYIEGHHAIREANRIFGFDGWAYEIDTLDVMSTEKNQKGNNVVCAMARVSVYALNVHREDVGYGTGIAKSMADAHEGAGKEAVTDALKRALRTFGDQFGNALYDKQQRHVEDAPKKAAPKAAPPTPEAIDIHLKAIGEAGTMDALRDAFGAATAQITDEAGRASLIAAKDGRKIELLKEVEG